MAQLYADLFVGEIHDQPETLAMLADLAKHARSLGLPILDVGCGPGHVTEYLATLGIEVIGIEPSPGMLEQARTRFPRRNFCRGSAKNLGTVSGCAAGIVSRFSTIHLLPAELPAVFDEYQRVLAPGGQLAISFFAADDVSQHGDGFDHKVATAYRVDADAMAQMLAAAGFVETERHFTHIENQRSNATILAVRSAGRGEDL